MDKQLGMAEFFAMEAGEYLDRLDVVVSNPGMPNGEELQRLTRALRGAALMANQQPIAATAGAFEQVARAVREGRRQWDDATRQLSIQAVDDLRRFVRRAREWTPDDTEQAKTVTAALEGVGGRPHAPRVSTAAAAAAPDAGTRAFVAREGAALASALARGAQALERNPHAPEALQAIRGVMQPLRGLATLSELPPQPDLLDAVDRAAAFIQRTGDPRGGGAQALDTAAKALSQATREVTGTGRADPDSVEVRRFTESLRALLGLEGPAVPIESLFFDDPGPHVVEPGTSPPSGPKLGEVELVALGEHLRQVATAVEEAPSASLRALRALALTDTLRTLEVNADEQLRSGARALARAGRDAVASDRPVTDATGFAKALKAAGAALTAGAAHPLGLARELAGIATQLEVRPGRAPAVAPAAVPGPIAEPAPAPPVVTAAAPPVAEPMLEEDHETPDLAGSLTRYHRYLETLGLGPASLSELLAGPPADPAIAASPAEPAWVAEPEHPEPDLDLAEEPLAPAAVPVATPPELVPITTLCYAGPTALDRALSLRDSVHALAASGASGPKLTELLDEIFDLVRLGLDGDR